MRKILVLTALLTCFAGVSLAGTLWEFSTPANANTNGNWTFGNTFLINNTITISALGYYDDNGDGFVDSHEVGIFSADGVLLASTVVTNADPLIGHWRYNSGFAPLTLTAGLSYEIVGVSHGDNYTWNDSGFVVDPNITYTGNGWAQDAGLAHLTQMQNDVTDGYWGPNAEFGTAPEPGTITSMLGAGLLGLLALRRRAR